MEKLEGLMIGDWEVIGNDHIEDKDFEYLEISINELLDANGLNEEQKVEFAKKYSAVNIHQLLCRETLETCYQVINDRENDERLSGLNAIVFLLMKPKGQRNRFHQLTSLKEYKELIDFAFERNAPIGFDSCSAPSFLKAVKDHKDYNKLEMLAEPCESDCFSSYVNTDGRFFHCSFTEGEDGWAGIDVVSCNDFMEDVWNSPEVCKFRGLLMDNAKTYGCRSCPIFNLTME